MKTRKVALLLGTLFISIVLIGQLVALIAAPASAMGIDTPNGVTAATALPLIADFESGIPAGFVGFADSWDGTGSATTLAMVTATSPLPVVPGAVSNVVVSVTANVATSGGWGGGPGYAGVSHDFSPYQDWSNYDGFGFWFKGSNTAQDLRIELKSNGTGPGVSTRFVYTFTDNFTTWQYFNIPWASFDKRVDFNPGGGLGNSIVLNKMWGYSVLLPAGYNGTFNMDQIHLIGFSTVYDFGSGIPAGFVGFADSWDGTGSATTLAMVTATSQLPVVPGTAGNVVVSVTANVATSGGWGGGPGYAGVSHDFSPFQDWSNYDGFSFWFKGSNTAQDLRIELKSNGTGPGVSTRFVYTFTDNFTTWQYFNIPWASFDKRVDFNPGGALGDSIVLSKMWGYSVLLPAGYNGTFNADNFAASGRAPQTNLTADFTSSAYSVNQGGTANITVTLSAVSAVTVTVDYSTTNGTAIAGTDYLTASGTLTFTPGITTASFSVSTIGTAVYGPNKTIGLGLGNANNAVVGALHNPATLTIVNDNPPPDTKVIENFEAGLPSGKDLFNNPIGFGTWGSTNGNVAITTTSGMTYTGGSLPNTVLKVTSNIESWGGFTDAFKDGNDWGKQDWSRYDGVRFWFYGTNSGKLIQIEIFDNRQLENLGDSAERWYQRFTDDFSGWKQISLPFAQFQRRSDYQPGGAPNDGLNLTDVSGLAFNMPSVASTTLYYVDQIEIYGDLSQHPATTRLSFSAYGYGAIEGDVVTAKLVLNHAAAAPVTVTYVITPETATPTYDFTGSLSGTVVFATGETSKTVTLQTVDDHQVEPREQLAIAITSATGAPIGYVGRSLLVIIDNDVADPKMLDDFESGVPVPLDAYGNVTVITQTVLSTSPIAVPGQDPINTVLSVTYDLPTGAIGGFTRKFETPQDLSQSEGLSFWYYGSGSGKTMTVTLLDNGQPDPGPTNWTLAWSDEFSGTNGAAPNPANWSYDTGGAGWGNNEWEYYTDSRDNSALDGNGNLVITAMTNTNPALTCASLSNAPCYATSARLLTAGKQEFTHGRVEARIQIPKGQGIWPAFWMLGNDIFTTNPWPASGEIDIMENIGKPSEQSTLYGTIHGPGYSGGSGIGSGPYVVTSTLADDFLVFAIEWEPTRIRWFVDGTNYFTATDTMIPAGTNWVFNHPFFILLNVAVGGNWPGYPDGTTVFPQQMKLDYVRVYQAPDTAERFETTFVDNTVGWRKVILPFSTFKRSATQPVNAPNNGLTLTAAQGYRFDLAGSPAALNASTALSGAFYLDEVRAADLVKVYLPIIRR